MLGNWKKMSTVWLPTNIKCKRFNILLQKSITDKTFVIVFS